MALDPTGDVPDINLPTDEQPEDPYQVTEQVEQPPSPVLHPQPKPKPKGGATSPGPVTHPSEVRATSSDGLPWWVWALALFALSRKRR